MSRVQDDHTHISRDLPVAGDRFVQQLNETKTEILRAFVEIAVRTELGLRALDRAEERLDRLNG